MENPGDELVLIILHLSLLCILKHCINLVFTVIRVLLGALVSVLESLTGSVSPVCLGMHPEEEDIACL